MQCWEDVGGCDAWMGGFFDPNSSTQWWTGWHLPGPAGLEGLRGWTWPNPDWILIGYELWGSYKKGDRLIEACYACPNPSTMPADQDLQQPSGHWHVTFRPSGFVKASNWKADILEEGHFYLKGSTSPKGGAFPKGGGKASPKGGSKGKGKGKGTISKGKGS